MRDRNALRERLMQRMQTGGRMQAGIFKSNLGVNFLKLAEGQNMFDIIPYIAGPFDPNSKEGDETYLLEVFVHQNCGIKEGKKICLLETYGRKCPVCEDRIRRQRAGGSEGSPEIIKALTPSRFPRTIYNVICYNSHEQEARGIQVFETSFYMLEMYLREMAKRALRPGDKTIDPLIPFMDIKEGKTIVFKAQEVGKPTMKFVGIRFEDRDYELDEKLIEKAHCLDKLIDIPTYEDMLQWYYGDEGEPAGAYRTGITRNESAQEFRRPMRTDNAPAPKNVGDNECPYGYNFGDVDSYKECNRCEVWDNCAKASVRMAKSAEEEEGDIPISPRRRGMVEEPEAKTETTVKAPARTESTESEMPRRRRMMEMASDNAEPDIPRRARRM